MRHAPPPLSHLPTAIIVMGVSGCGKSTLAHAIANRLAIDCLDADDFHPPENKAQMAAGRPLTDDMRGPWVTALGEQLGLRARAGNDVVLAFSGLKRAHRDQLRAGNTLYQTVFLHLAGDRALIAERMQARVNHFMPISLLDSQFESLEATDAESDIVMLDIRKPLTQLLDEALSLLPR